MARMAKIGLVVVVAVAGGLVLAGLPAGQSSVRAGPTEGGASRQVPRLVDLGANKCIPCKAMAPILEQLRFDFAGRLEVVFIDVWKDPAAAEPYRIHMIPTQIFFAADGRELARHQGFISREEILAQWKTLGVEL